MWTTKAIDSKVMKRALIVQGGWDGHQPVEIAELFRSWLSVDGFEVVVSDSLESFADVAYLKGFDLLVPHWTMGQIEPAVVNGLLEAVRTGTGIAGCHGGMGDAFRNESEYQFMVGGQFVAHPGNDGRLYDVKCVADSPLVGDLGTFTVSSEKYYMHVDPAMRIHAFTTFEDYADTPMPVVWTKMYGEGRVFYCSLGHHADVLEVPVVEKLMRRGFAWATGEGPAEIGRPFASLFS